MGSMMLRFLNLTTLVYYATVFSFSLVKAQSTAETTTPEIGLYTVDYIIIGVASAAIAASISLLIAVIIMNRKKSKQAIKIDPNHEQGAIIKNETATFGNNSVAPNLYEDEPLS